MRSSILFLRAFAILLICIALTLACNLSAIPISGEGPTLLPTVAQLSPTLAPIVTNTVVPSLPPPPSPTPGLTCLKWDQITLDMAGEEVCVYGIAYSQQGKSRIDFSPEKNSFFLVDAEFYYPNLTEGSCVVAEGVVEVFGERIPFISINGQLYQCEPWMLE